MHKNQNSGTGFGLATLPTLSHEDGRSGIRRRVGGARAILRQSHGGGVRKSCSSGFPRSSRYSHVLFLSWLAPGGRGIIALDLLNCTSIQSVPSSIHPMSWDNAGTIAAREQTNEPNSLPLMDMLVPLYMMYADGIERLAVNRLINVPDSVSVTRSLTGSIGTILTVDSNANHTSDGSRSTVFVSLLSSIPDISDM